MNTSIDLPESEKRIHLFRIFDSGISADPLDEIIEVLQLFTPSIDTNFITTCHQDIGAFFNGHYSGFKANNNKYHDLRHTYAVALATARLFHGLFIEGQRFETIAVMNGMMSAYFHDTGLLLRSSDNAENGAEYTRCHEVRSIQVLENYLGSRNFDRVFVKDCGDIINCTNIEFDFESITFSRPEIKHVAQVVATADISAQMADRYYLELLPYLYQERRVGGLVDHESAFELMKGTAWFYDTVISKRMETVLGDIDSAMKTHFQARWHIDRNLYKENIRSNIDYLQVVVEKCRKHPERMLTYLQRRPPSSEQE